MLRITYFTLTRLILIQIVSHTLHSNSVFTELCTCVAGQVCLNMVLTHCLSKFTFKMSFASAEAHVPLSISMPLKYGIMHFAHEWPFASVDVHAFLYFVSRKNTESPASHFQCVSPAWERFYNNNTKRNRMKKHTVEVSLSKQLNIDRCADTNLNIFMHFLLKTYIFIMWFQNHFH